MTGGDVSCETINEKVTVKSSGDDEELATMPSSNASETSLDDSLRSNPDNERGESWVTAAEYAFRSSDGPKVMTAASLDDEDGDAYFVNVDPNERTPVAGSKSLPNDSVSTHFDSILERDMNGSTLTLPSLPMDHDDPPRRIFPKKGKIPPLRSIDTNQELPYQDASPDGTEKSEFRRSLDDELLEKRRLRKLEEERIANSKKLLRESINAMTAKDSIQSVLTLPERNFLESLLESDAPGAAEACAEAHKRLMDADLFFLAICGGAAAEVGSLMPGGGWEANDSTSLQKEEFLNGVDERDDWVQDWVSRGSGSKEGSENSNAGDAANQREKPSGNIVANKNQNNSHSLTSSGLSNSTVDRVVAPYDLQRNASSALRLNRLALRRRQSSAGGDNNRLFRAHEAGLIVTLQGSARRSLMRMGLPMEKGLYPPPPNTLRLDSTNRNVSGLGDVPDFEDKATSTEFEIALAKMDERAIRRIEKEEREKQRLEKESLAHRPAGCVSPFSMGMLKKMYASKQFSFHRQSSSYTRFDSFLSNKNSFDSSLVEIDNKPITSVPSKSDSRSIINDRDSIFRPSSRHTGGRLRNLLVSAGLQDPKDHSVGLIMESSPEKDEEVMSTSTNSVAVLINEGGPNHWEGEDMVFRNSSNSEGVEIKNPILRKMHPNESRNPSLVSSLGSKSAGGSDSKEDVDDTSKLAPAKSDLLGELPPIRIPKHLSKLHKRSNTLGIMKGSSSSTSPSTIKKERYQRSVSWGHMVGVKEGEDMPMKNTIPGYEGLTVISFPNLRRAVPLRSESAGSTHSIPYPPPRISSHLRSDSLGSVASHLSAIPPLSRAHPVFSPRGSVTLSSPPPLSHAHAIRSDSVGTLGTELEEYSTCSYPSGEISDRPRGPAWTNPLASRRFFPPRFSHSRQSSAAFDPPVLIRQASINNYEGEGIEVTTGSLAEPEEIVQVDSLDSARRFKSMISMSENNSVVSTRSKMSARLSITSLDDSFIIRNVNFERHTSEILRSLSNEDLFNLQNAETVGGDQLKRHKSNDANSSMARVFGDIGEAESWDLHSNHSFTLPQNAWNVFEDEYAEGYGANNSLPFRILGTSADDTSCHPHVLSPPLMESLQNFFPPGVSEDNFWLKYSLVRDGASLHSLLRYIRGAKHTLIGIETVDGEVFGSFTSSPWRKNWNYFGTGESFLWRMRRTRSDKDACYSILDQAKLESELDVFYWTGKNAMVQYCTHDMIAVGGGSLSDDESNLSASKEVRDQPPQSSGGHADKGGFGLAIDSELLRGTSSLCATFGSPPLSRIHEDGSPFEIVNLEVWTLTPCMNVGDAENLEMKKLFLEPYSSEDGPSL